MTDWHYPLNARVLLTGDYTTQPVASWRVVARCRQEALWSEQALTMYTVEPWVRSGTWAVDRPITWVPEAYLAPYLEESPV